MSEARILSVGTALPPFEVSQEEMKGLARDVFSGAFRDLERLLPVFDNSGVSSRRFCMPLDWVRENHTFGEKNDLYREKVLELSVRAAEEALALAGAEPEEVGTVFFVSNSGLATPSLDSKLIFSLELSPHTRRIPVWGLGCAGGASGLARAAEYARLEPEKLTLLVAAESASLVGQSGDLSKTNLVAASLFSDGAAAVLVGSGRRPADGPTLALLGSRSTTWAGTEDVMGWRLTEPGLAVQLSRSVPTLVRERFREDLWGACASLGLSPDDLSHFLLHPGGSKVLDAFEDVLDLGPGGLKHSRSVLRELGNMSSATVLFILRRFFDGLASGPPEDAGLGVLSALGPGFSSEQVLFRCA